MCVYINGIQPCRETQSLIIHKKPMNIMLCNRLYMPLMQRYVVDAYPSFARPSLHIPWALTQCPVSVLTSPRRRWKCSHMGALAATTRRCILTIVIPPYTESKWDIWCGLAHTPPKALPGDGWCKLTSSVPSTLVAFLPFKPIVSFGNASETCTNRYHVSKSIWSSSGVLTTHHYIAYLIKGLADILLQGRHIQVDQIYAVSLLQIPVTSSIQ